MSFVGDAAHRNCAVLVMICVIVPAGAVAILWWRCAGFLDAVVPIEPTGLDALRVLLKGFIHPSERHDSWGPMLQALSALHGAERNRLYDNLFFLGQVRFQYPPTSLLFLSGVSAMGLSSFSALNQLNLVAYLLNAAGIGVLTWLVFRDPKRIGMQAGRRSLAIEMAAIATGAALVFYPVVRAVVLGQIQMWIDLMFTGAMIAWVLDRRLVAGLLVGLACAIKPQFALLLLWGVLWREWAFGIGFIAGLAPVATISLLSFGLDVHFGYLRVLSFLSQHGESYFANNSVNGILNGYLSPTDSLFWDDNHLTPYVPAVYAGTLAASLLALAAVVLPPLLRRDVRPDAAQFGAAAICTVIGSPIAWEHHYALLLPVYSVALRCVLDEQNGLMKRAQLACLAISWILVANFIPFVTLFARTSLRFVQAHFFFGGLLLLVLLLVCTFPRRPQIRVALARSSAAT